MEIPKYQNRCKPPEFKLLEDDNDFENIWIEFHDSKAVVLTLNIRMTFYELKRMKMIMKATQ